MFVTLANGKEDLKALILKDRKKKAKKTADVLNLGRRFRGPLKQMVDLTSSTKEGDNQEGETREEDPSPGESDNDTNYNEERYPPDDERYKQLEDHLNAMEIQRVPGLDFEELGLVFGVVTPKKFKVLVFSKYDGVSCPKLHLHSYVRKIQPHTADRNLSVYFFQYSLSRLILSGSIN